MKLRVGLLGMSDNMSTRAILAEMARLGRSPDVVFLQHAGLREQWRRLRRKLKGAGVAATLGRIVFAARSRFPDLDHALDTATAPATTVHRVGGANAEHTRRLIRAAGLDLLLLATDSLLGHGTFSLPRLATLNAHPGWAPRYRGLSSVTRMLRDGILPAITVHIVDEGVDTGPVILREHVDRNVACEGAQGELACYREQARLFARAIALFETGRAVPINTFLEWSSMSRGLSAAESRSVHAAALRQPDLLRRLDADGAGTDVSTPGKSLDNFAMAGAPVGRLDGHEPPELPAASELLADPARGRDRPQYEGAE